MTEQNLRCGQDCVKSLHSSIYNALEELEQRGEIVLCSSSPENSAKFLEQKLRSVVVSSEISVSELSSIRSLIYHAIRDKRFFDWEMPTLTGLTAEEFASLADRLPNV